MKKLATFIVNQRKIIVIVFIALMVFSAWGMSQVKIEYSITSYLPSSTDTKKALDIMEEEFVTYGTTTIMVRNISYSEAEKLHDEIENYEGVKSFEFNSTPDYYKNSCALFKITFDGDDEDEQCVEAFNKTLELLSGHDALVSVSLTDTMADDLARDINFVLLLAIVVIIAVFPKALRKSASF